MAENNLPSKLLSQAPRESSGSSTSGKYDYQKDMSIYLLVNRHKEDGDYVFLFDFHDDLAILDSVENPTTIDFYQVKGKSIGNWTINKLTTPEKEQAFSIVSKMYYNKELFPQNTRSLNFISNANFSFDDLVDGSKSTSRSNIKGPEINKTDCTLFNQIIKTELSMTNQPEFERYAVFSVSNLSIKESSNHTIGAVAELINELNPKHKINPSLAYRQILLEVNRKTAAEISKLSPSDLKQLVALKGLSRSDFESMLKNAGLYKSSEEQWDEISKLLYPLVTGVGELKKYKAAYGYVTALELNETSNTPWKKLIDKIDLEIDIVLSDVSNDSMHILDLTDKIVNEGISSGLNLTLLQLKCLVIKRIHEKE